MVSTKRESICEILFMNVSQVSHITNRKDNDQLLDSIDNPLVHYCDDFSSFLGKALVNTKVIKVESRRKGRLVGVMPLAICTDKKLGTVINSLPFYGSHGGPIVIDEVARADLLGQIPALINEYKPRCVTIIENPFSPLRDEDLFQLGFTVCDDRVGQITLLPSSMDNFHLKTRNAIRKGQKLQQTIQLAETPEDWEWMQGIHERSISSLGGVPKSMKIFNALRASFGASAQLWIGKVNGLRISGIVIIHYRDTIEYFTPVVEEAYRDTQALSATIYSVMQWSTLKGARKWNWGGTWRTQEGVYRFKNRWGAQDLVYRYFNHISDTSITDEPISDLFSAFPYFYLFKLQS